MLSTEQPSKKSFVVVDLFCGAGGSTSGVSEACEELGLDYQLICINHWDQAISTHSANHPKATHLCTAIDNVDPKKVVPGGRINLMWASPECTHHSIARGGRPMNDQSRASAWHVIRWAESLYIDAICIENVREFQNYGPLGINGRPIKAKQGETFRAFIEALRSLSYRVEWKVLNAADYGDPTTRERFFLLARRNNRKIVWPEPSHSADGGTDLFGSKKKWRGAREIIDWAIPNASIFTRKKPLAASTMRRIEAGISKFCGEYAQPFLVMLRNHGNARSLEEPVPALCAHGNHVGLAESNLVQFSAGAPFILQQQSGGVPRSVAEPLPTVATKGAIAVVEPVITPDGPVQQDLAPFLVHTQHPHHTHKSVEDPMGTVTAQSSTIALCEPFLVEYHGNHPDRHDGDVRVKSIHEPLPTQTCANRFGLAQPVAVPGESGPPPDPESFIIPPNRPNDTSYPVSQPVRTVTATSSDFGLVTPFLTPIDHQSSGAEVVRSIDEPTPTITTKNRLAVVEPFLIPFFGERAGQDPRTHSVSDPLPTVTSHGAGGLVQPYIVPLNHGKNDVRTHSIDCPMPTVTSVDAWGLVEAQAKPEESRLDSSAIVQPPRQFSLDVKFRMLQPAELASAMSFPHGYVFKGTREDVVKQIGNAVPVKTAKALAKAIIPSRELGRAWYPRPNRARGTVIAAPASRRTRQAPAAVAQRKKAA